MTFPHCLQNWTATNSAASCLIPPWEVCPGFSICRRISLILFKVSLLIADKTFPWMKLTWRSNFSVNLSHKAIKVKVGNCIIAVEFGSVRVLLNFASSWMLSPEARVRSPQNSCEVLLHRLSLLQANVQEQDFMDYKRAMTTCDNKPGCLGHTRWKS